MKEKTFYILIIVALLAINGFTLVRFYKIKQQSNVLLNQESNKSDELNSYKINFAVNILNSNYHLDNVIIKDSLNNILSLKELFKDKQEQLLVCRFSQMHCESCVNSSIQILRNRIDSIGTNKVVFLGNHRNNKIFNRVIPLYKIQDMRVYNCPAINIPVEKLGYPYYFILDKNLQISNVFVPDKAKPNITNKYLENICKRFWHLLPSFEPRNNKKFVSSHLQRGNWNNNK